jgi:hypothetical protein
MQSGRPGSGEVWQPFRNEYINAPCHRTLEHYANPFKPTMLAVPLSVAAVGRWKLGYSSATDGRWSPPVVSQPYATYKGSHNEMSGLDVFLGLRYAATTKGAN